MNKDNDIIFEVFNLWCNIYNDKDNQLHKKYISPSTSSDKLILNFKTIREPEPIGQSIKIIQNTTTVAPIELPTPDANVISNIAKLNTYVSGELTDKTNKMEDVLKIQNRWNKFNDTYKKRYIEYTKIICIIVFDIICVWLCKVISKQGIVPDGFLTFIIIFILSLSAINIYLINNEISRHNVMDYDQLNYQPPALIEKGAALQSIPTPTGSNQETCSSVSCPTDYEYKDGYCVPNSLNLISA
jgi:hypothetical protein